MVKKKFANGQDRSKSYLESFKNYKTKLPGANNGEAYFPSRPKARGDEEEKWLSWMQKQFEQIAGEDHQIDLNEFKKALGVKKSFFAERFFALFDQDKSGTIEPQELMDGLHMLTKGSPIQKLKFLFDVYDSDGSGTIDKEELKTVLKSSMEESSIQLPEERLDELTTILFEDADTDNSGSISFEELSTELEKHPGVLENLTISAANWLKPPSQKKGGDSNWPRYLTKTYLRNNVRKVVFYGIFLAINLWLFIWRTYVYWDTHWSVGIARGCGMCLNFNAAFILVLMLRYTLTLIRSSPIGSYLPLDQSISIHKVVGWTIFIQSVIHTIAHLIFIDYAVGEPTINPNGVTYARWLFTLDSGIGTHITPGFAYWSGHILLISLTIMFICSQPFVRRSGHFQVFYWTHMLYIVFWVFLILHGRIFWYFFIVPGCIFVVEYIYKLKPIQQAVHGHVYVKEVNLLPSKVTNLIISKPKRFSYQPGDYVFINIPAIAQFEWHPFTISSAPEMPDHFWLHVRSAGNWTNKLNEFFTKLEPKGEDNSAFVDMNPGEEAAAKAAASGSRKDSIQETYNPLGATKNRSFKRSIRGPPSVTDKNKKCAIECYIDGPYGTATREIFETEHAVLIGSGIGVTPYASILQSVLYRYKAMRRHCPVCDNVWFGRLPASIMKLKKVDFIWVNREQKSFEWFVSLLANIEMHEDEMQKGKSSEEHEKRDEPFIDMQMFMTAAHTINDMKGLALQMAMEIMHEDGGIDAITGLRTRTQPGRPKWKQLLTEIGRTKKGKVKVFFCGAPVISQQLKGICQELGFEFGKENF